MSQTLQTQPGPRPMKRLIVLSDGTWQSPESSTITNILKLAMAILPESSDGIQQAKYYDSGVGTNGHFDKLLGGGLGLGLDINIREMYMWLSMNYDEGDEIHLFGFSRGSYTVRSLAGFIRTAGLVRRTDVQYAKEAYELYRSRPSETLASEFRRQYSHRPHEGEHVPIKLLACFDTVGALGVPDTLLGGRLDNRRYKFHDTFLSVDIQHAIHVLSVDEERGGFKPTLMEECKECPGQLTQLYFPGVHSGVGGGEPLEEDIANYTLTWMVDEIRRRGLGLAVDSARISPGKLDGPLKPKGGLTVKSLFIRATTGKYVRPITAVEQCHPSVAHRYALRDDWRPEALLRTGADLARLAKDILSGKRPHNLALGLPTPTLAGSDSSSSSSSDDEEGNTTAV